MRILVSGGAGYIGSVTSAALLDAGYDVVIFDNLRQGHRQAVPAAATFVLGDLNNIAEIRSAFEAHGPFDGILNFASHTLVGESMQHPEYYLRDSVVAGINLLTVAAEHGVKAFILSSTANLFDDPAKMPIDENERIVPGSPYGEMKSWMERALYWYERVHGIRYGALRYFNACGCTPTIGEHHDPETHLIPLVLQVALGQRESIAIFGDDYPTPDGSCVRDYVHVSDLASPHILTLQALLNGGASRRYNLGNGGGFSVKEVIQAVRNVTGHAIPAVVAPRRAGDPATLVASSETIRRELGWEPRYATIESIIESAWAWHQQHPHGYSK